MPYKNKKDRNAWARRYYSENIEKWREYKRKINAKRKEYMRRGYLKIKQRAYLIVGRGSLKCVCGCGCTDIRFLEINHKNGNKSKEVKGYVFYCNIVTGRRGIRDLELTCSPYNRGVHALMLKYGLSEAPFTITFKPTR